MSSDQAAAIGAFLSGIGSVLSATWYVRRSRKRAEADCDKRIDEIKRALHEGVEIERGSHEDRSPTG